MKIILALVIAVLLSACLSSNSSSDTNHTEKDIAYGPFTIRTKVTTSKQFNMNTGMVDQTDVAYTVLHNGKPIGFPNALQKNTGLSYLWRVYTLPDAPDPTLIAGSQSLYLIYLENGTPIVKPILQQHHDFASLQFLDSENGQPGPYSEVYTKDITDNIDQLDSLSGGRFLLVSKHAVLDTQTRTIQHINTSNNDVENYSFPSLNSALAFSPDRKSIVFRGHFQSWNTLDENLPDSEHALVVYHIENDSGYAVKFDDTELRLPNRNEMNFSWFQKFFEWKNSTQGDRLQLRKLKQAPYWMGRFKVEHSTSPYYTLYPVKATMLPVFLKFLEQQKGWTKTNIVEDTFHEYTGRVITFTDGNLKFDVRMKESEQTLLFSKHIYAKDHSYVEVVKKLADAFDAELAAGKHQEHFGRIISETKRIKGIDGYKP